MSTALYLTSVVATLATEIKSTLELNRLFPRTPLVCEILPEPVCALSATKEYDAYPPHSVTSELNLAVESTIRLFLTLVSPP